MQTQKTPPLPSTASISRQVMGAYAAAGRARDGLHHLKKHWAGRKLSPHVLLAADLVDQARRALFTAEAALGKVVVQDVGAEPEVAVAEANLIDTRQLAR